MKKIIVFVVVFSVLIVACGKKETGCMPVPPESEDAQIKAYAVANGIDSAVKHSSGLYYKIIAPGTGVVPTASSRITVSYVGKLMTNSTFDQSANYSEVLSNLIEGWMIGIPLIKKGGEIKLIIPSSLAYGCNGVGPVPSNAVLYFDIVLKDVQ